MRAVIQRVRRASVTIDGTVVGRIEQGLLVLFGVHTSDSRSRISWMAEKLSGLRIFEDTDGKMNLSIQDVKGSMLVVSQFTLYGDCEKGRRPSFIEAARPEVAEPIYEEFVQALRALGVPVETGRFGADMQVELCNDGPVTLVIDTP